MLNMQQPSCMHIVLDFSITCRQQPIVATLSCRLFLSGSYDSTVTVWDFQTLLPIKTHYNYDATITDASFSHDSQLLALGGDEPTIRINHTKIGEPCAVAIMILHADIFMAVQSQCSIQSGLADSGFLQSIVLQPIRHISWPSLDLRDSSACC